MTTYLQILLVLMGIAICFAFHATKKVLHSHYDALSMMLERLSRITHTIMEQQETIIKLKKELEALKRNEKVQ